MLATRSAKDALARLWADAGLPSDLLSQVELTGFDPVMPSSFAVGTAAQASVAASTTAAAEFFRLRGGPTQRIGVDSLHALLEFRGERYLLLDGQNLPEHWAPVSGRYLCGDGRWVMVHANLPHHQANFLSLLDYPADRNETEKVLREKWTAFDFEEAAPAYGIIAGAIRTLDEWDAHPHKSVLAAQPLVAIERIGDAPPLVLPDAERPLDGLRVLDLTRIIAGPTCGRILAGHGAEVLLITAAHLPSVFPLVVSSGRGKRAAELDLRTEEGLAGIRDLLGDTDVVLQSYRPGALARFGLDAASLAQAAGERGIVYATVSAYGETGPWGGRRGFDSIVQAAIGFNHAEGEASGTGNPTSLPAQALDYATGNLMAFGVMAALHRRVTVGGSWQVKVSLARTAQWLRDLGRTDYVGRVPDMSEIAPYLEQIPSNFGLITTVSAAASLSHTPMRWDLPPAPLGTHAPTWQQ